MIDVCTADGTWIASLFHLLCTLPATTTMSRVTVNQCRILGQVHANYTLVLIVCIFLSIDFFPFLTRASTCIFQLSSHFDMRVKK